MLNNQPKMENKTNDNKMEKKTNDNGKYAVHSAQQPITNQKKNNVSV